MAGFEVLHGKQKNQKNREKHYANVGNIPILSLS